jgi:hypothetical protein
MAAIDKDDVKTVESLLDQGVSVNCVSSKGEYSALTMACRLDKPKIVRVGQQRQSQRTHDAATAAARARRRHPPARQVRLDAYDRGIASPAPVSE